MTDAIRPLPERRKVLTPEEYRAQRDKAFSDDQHARMERILRGDQNNGRAVTDYDIHAK